MPLFLLTALGWGKSAVSNLLNFCSKPPGSWIAAAVALALGLWWYGQHEFNRGEAMCETAHAEAAAQEAARIIAATAAVNDRSNLRTEASEARNIQNRTIVRVIHDQAAEMPDHDATCISPDIADRLRDIQ